MSQEHTGAAEEERSNSRDRARTLRERMAQDLQLRGMAERYLREVRKLACYFDTPPDQLSEQQVADYLLYLINDCEFAPGSLRVAHSGLKFFYTFTEPRDLPTVADALRQHGDDREFELWLDQSANHTQTYTINTKTNRLSATTRSQTLNC